VKPQMAWNQSRIRELFFLFLSLLLVLALCGGCSASSNRFSGPIIHLHKLETLPTPTNKTVKPLRVAVAAIISPQGTVDSYTPLRDYLSQKSGRPVQLVQRRTYQEVNDLIKNGDIDMAFVCTRAYVVGHRSFGMELLAAPQVNGKTVYYSYLIVPANSTAQSIRDLRGKVFAFTDPLSNTGYMYPLSLLADMGQTPKTFFAETFFTYSHDNAIRAVADRLADGAAVDSLVYANALKKDPTLRERTRVIERSQPFGMPPVVVAPRVRPQTKALLQNILFSMNGDPAGRAALSALGIDRFIPVDNADYNSVRALELKIKVP